MISAHKYEIRCHTSRAALTEATFALKGILVHGETVPAPAAYGHRQSARVSVPWPNQGWKLMSCSHCQEMDQQASWLLIGYTRV